MAYGALADAVLGKINRSISVDVEDYDGTCEWILLESDNLSDNDLFYALRKNWHQIVGQNYGRFALLYCVQQPDSGVWIHCLSASDTPAAYAPGCFKLGSW